MDTQHSWISQAHMSLFPLNWETSIVYNWEFLFNNANLFLENIITEKYIVKNIKEYFINILMYLYSNLFNK